MDAACCVLFFRLQEEPVVTPTNLRPTAVLNVVGLTPSLIGKHTPRIAAFRNRHAQARLREPFPEGGDQRRVLADQGRRQPDDVQDGGGAKVRWGHVVSILCSISCPRVPAGMTHASSLRCHSRSKMPGHSARINASSFAMALASSLSSFGRCASGNTLHVYVSTS
jgi:hypothetical protein